ncbi:MAG: YsnF/AvaK domain-containing protein [Janthinobacterium lividum]
MSHTVIGIFDHTSEAQEAVSNLLSNGFSKESIDLSTRAEREGISSSYDDEESHAGISGFFGNLFGSSDEDTAKYSQVGQRGAIVTVHASSAQQAESAALILDNYGALDVSERAESYKATGTVAPATTGTTTDADSIKIIEEKMQVGKREVETGGVRLRSRIVEQAVHEDVRLRSERVHVERTNVSRPATEADLAAFKDATITMKETAEVPVVSKEAFVTGEVSLGKEVEETNQTVQGTVRKTEVDTENFTDEKSSLAADKTALSAIKGDKL